MSNHGFVPARPAALATAAVLAVACGGSSSPYAPQPSPSAATVTAEMWTLTYEVIEASGSFCVDLPGMGQSGRTMFTLVKGERAASFNMWDSDRRHGYSVVLNGLEFAGTVPTRDSAPGMCVHHREDLGISGSFADGGTQLRATETWKFTLDSGEVVTRRFRWTAHPTSWEEEY